MGMPTAKKRQNRVDRLVEKYKAKQHAGYCELAQADFNKLRRMQSRVWFDHGSSWLIECFTCDFVFRSTSDTYGRRIDAGHFISKGSTLIRFDPINVNPQCTICNRHHHSNAAVYRERMIEVYGQGEVDRLEHLASVTHTWNREVLASMAIQWRDLCSEIEKRGRAY